MSLVLQQDGYDLQPVPKPVTPHVNTDTFGERTYICLLFQGPFEHLYAVSGFFLTSFCCFRGLLNTFMLFQGPFEHLYAVLGAF